MARSTPTSTGSSTRHLLVRTELPGAFSLSLRALEQGAEEPRVVLIHLASTETEKRIVDRIQAALEGRHSPGMARLRRVFDLDDTRVAVLDHPLGTSLETILRRNQAMGLRAALELGLDLAGTLAALKSHDGDRLQPASVRIDAAGEVTLTCLPLNSGPTLSLLIRGALAGVLPRELRSREEGIVVGGEPLSRAEEATAKALLVALEKAPGDWKGAVARIQATVEEIEGLSLADWASAAVPIAQRSLPPAALDSRYGCMLQDLEAEELSSAPPSARKPPSQPPRQPVATPPRDTMPPPSPARKAALEPPPPLPPPRPRRPGEMPDIRISADSPVMQARSERNRKVVLLAVLLLLVGASVVLIPWSNFFGSDELPPEPEVDLAADHSANDEVEDVEPLEEDLEPYEEEATEEEASTEEEADEGELDVEEPEASASTSSGTPSTARSPASSSRSTKEPASSSSSTRTSKPEPEEPGGPRIIGGGATGRTGEVSITVGSADEVWLVGSRGRVDPGELSPGTYQIKARFDGGGTNTAGTFTLRQGQSLKVWCNPATQVCRADPVR